MAAGGGFNLHPDPFQDTETTTKRHELYNLSEKYDFLDPDDEFTNKEAKETLKFWQNHAKLENDLYERNQKLEQEFYVSNPKILEVQKYYDGEGFQTVPYDVKVVVFIDGSPVTWQAPQFLNFQKRFGTAEGKRMYIEYLENIPPVEGLIDWLEHPEYHDAWAAKYGINRNSFDKISVKPPNYEKLPFSKGWHLQKQINRHQRKEKDKEKKNRDARKAALGLAPRTAFKSNELNPYILDLDFSNLSLN